MNDTLRAICRLNMWNTGDDRLNPGYEHNSLEFQRDLRLVSALATAHEIIAAERNAALAAVTTAEQRAVNAETERRNAAVVPVAPSVSGWIVLGPDNKLPKHGRYLLKKPELDFYHIRTKCRIARVRITEIEGGSDAV